MIEREPYWQGDHWCCEGHLQTVRLPAAADRCWYYRCPSQRPLLASEMCAWPECEEARRATSKYCSRACSNKNARKRHRDKGKL